MKSFRTLVIILITTLCTTNRALAQMISNNVHALYFQSIAYPEEFDFSPELLEASGLLKKQILSCLIPLK
ncbi:MAG: hypothetical protein ACJA13_000251 [Paraglaciecola sp.]|jgi:hypothetical protein